MVFAVAAYRYSNGSTEFRYFIIIYSSRCIHFFREKFNYSTKYGSLRQHSFFSASCSLFLHILFEYKGQYADVYRGNRNEREREREMKLLYSVYTHPSLYNISQTPVYTYYSSRKGVILHIRTKVYIVHFLLFNFKIFAFQYMCTFEKLINNFHDSFERECFYNI